MAAKKGGKPMIVIRKEEIVEAGHHGGAWKVAYADFVTAMMAFFLLMWLLNATTEEQRKGLADYFSPSNVMSRNNSGFGAPFGGLTPNIEGSLASDKGAVQVVMARPHPLVDAAEDEEKVPAQHSNRQTAGETSLDPPDGQGDRQGDTQTDGQEAGQKDGQGDAQQGTARPNKARLLVQLPGSQTAGPSAEEAQWADYQQRERADFEKAAEQMREAVRQDPALAEIAKQLLIDITPEGLRIQILDEDRRPMFPSGSAVVNDRARALLTKIAPVLVRLPEPIAIAGHTDSAPFRGGERTNWDLSADRANATRRLLVDSGLQEERIRSVTGNADRDPLIKDDPLAAANRRIAIVVLRTAPGGPPASPTRPAAVIPVKLPLPVPAKPVLRIGAAPEGR